MEPEAWPGPDHHALAAAARRELEIAAQRIQAIVDDHDEAARRAGTTIGELAGSTLWRTLHRARIAMPLAHLGSGVEGFGVVVTADGVVLNTKESWQHLAHMKAGIDPATWDPEAGFDANHLTVLAVYDYYLGLYGRDGDLHWAALARLAGAPVYAGMLELGAPAAQAPPMGEASEWMRTQLMVMQQAIFDDLAWQHEAYLAGGLEALEAHVDTDYFNVVTFDAWQHIASGDPDRVAEGTRELVYREQDPVLQPFYDEWREHAELHTVVTSANAQSPVPGGMPFREMVAGGLVDVWDDHRKVWIDEDMLDALAAFLDDPGHGDVLAVPLAERITEFQFSLGGLGMGGLEWYYRQFYPEVFGDPS